jgi:hypothetical protein
MDTVLIPRHPGDVDLTWEQIRDALGALEGARVTVRVVERSDPEMLMTVFQGNLGMLSHEKHPALFWPVRPSGGLEPADALEAVTHFQRDRFHVEAAGFYLHHDRFQGGVGRAGCTVLAITQGPVLINIRRS